MRSGPFRLVGGSRDDRRAVAAALAVVPPTIAEAAHARLLTYRVDSDPRRRYGYEHDSPGEEVAGLYVPDLWLAVVRPGCRAWTVWHEMGHALDRVLGGGTSWSLGAGMPELWTGAASFPTCYAMTHPSENFAERFAEYVQASTGYRLGEHGALAPGWETRAPRMANVLEKYLTGPARQEYDTRRQPHIF